MKGKSLRIAWGEGMETRAEQADSIPMYARQNARVQRNAKRLGSVDRAMDSFRYCLLRDRPKRPLSQLPQACENLKTPETHLTLELHWSVERGPQVLCRHSMFRREPIYF